MANKDKWSLGAAVLASVATILAYYGGKNEASDDGTLTSALDPCKPDTVTYLCTDETSADAKMTYMYQNPLNGTPQHCSDITISSLNKSGTTEYSCTKCPFLPQYENNLNTLAKENLNAIVDIHCWAPDNYNAVPTTGLPQIPRLQQDNTVKEDNTCREPDGSALPSLDYKVGQVQPVDPEETSYVRCMRSDSEEEYVWMKFSYSTPNGIFDKMVQFSQYCTDLLKSDFTSKMQYFAQSSLHPQEETIQDATIQSKTCVANNYTTSTSLDTNHDYANVASCYGKNNNGEFTYQCPAGYQIQLSGCTQCPAGTVTGDANGYSCSACGAGTTANNDRTLCETCGAGYTGAGVGCMCETFKLKFVGSKECTHTYTVFPPSNMKMWITTGVKGDVNLPSLIEPNNFFEFAGFGCYDSPPDGDTYLSRPPDTIEVLEGAGTVDFWWKRDDRCNKIPNSVPTYFMWASGSQSWIDGYVKKDRSSAHSNNLCYKANPSGMITLSLHSGMAPYDTTGYHTYDGDEQYFVRFKSDCDAYSTHYCTAFDSVLYDDPETTQYTCAGTATDTCTDTAGVDCTISVECLRWCYRQEADGCCYRTDDGTCEFYHNVVPTWGTSSKHHAAACVKGT